VIKFGVHNPGKKERTCLPISVAGVVSVNVWPEDRVSVNVWPEDRVSVNVWPEDRVSVNVWPEATNQHDQKRSQGHRHRFEREHRLSL